MQFAFKGHWLIRVWVLVLTSSTPGCGGPELQDEEPTFEARPHDLERFSYCVNPSEEGTGTEYELHLEEGEAVMVGTCGIAESSAEGDTVLSLYAPDGGLVASNDNGSAYGCGLASKVDFTALSEGLHRVRIGCVGDSACQGTMAISRRVGIVPFDTGNTNNATLNTYNRQFKFNAGQFVRVSTCAGNVHGALARGDTYLRLFRQSAGLYAEVASNNDAQGCGAAAEVGYTIPEDGYYQIRFGCNTNTS